MSKLNKTIWTLSALRAFLYSLIVTGSAFKAAVAITPWSAMTHDQGVELVVSLFVVQAGVMLAFLDQTIAKLSSEAAPPNAPPAANGGLSPQITIAPTPSQPMPGSTAAPLHYESYPPIWCAELPVVIWNS